MDKPYFELRDLAVGYGGKPILSQLSLSLERGGIMTLMGPNGSGKSTILKTVARRLPAISGEIRLDGEDLRSMPGGKLSKKMAVVLTDRIRPELMTCFEIAAAGRYPYTGVFGVLTAHDRKVVYSALEQVNAADIADRDFTSVSDGQRQRVLLARAIAQEPEIIVLDEPTSFLDIRHKIELLEILRAMAKERGVAIIMSLHEIDLASKVSDVIVCVSGGGISGWGKPEEVFSDASVRRLYGLERGFYNAALGSVELARPEGTPRIFVVGGGGYGIPFYRGLQKAGIPFFAGILFENDVDLAVAAPLAAEVVTCGAFSAVTDGQIAAAKALIDVSDAVVDAGCPLGVFNRANGELIAYARSRGKRICSDITGLLEVKT